MVEESKAWTVLSSSSPSGSSAYSGRAMAINSWANAAWMRQSRRRFAFASVLREMPPRIPMWCSLRPWARSDTSMSRRLVRHDSCAKAMQRNWLQQGNDFT